MLKLRLALPIIVLALSVVACGKKTDQPITQALGVAPIGGGGVWPWPGGGGGYPTTQAFCQAYQQQGYNAVMSGGSCMFTSTVYSGNFYFGGYNYTWTPKQNYTNSPIQIAQYDSVSITASGGNLTAYVSGYAQSPFSSFTANTSGYLQIRANGWATGSVSNISLQRCYSLTNGYLSTVSCTPIYSW